MRAGREGRAISRMAGFMSLEFTNSLSAMAVLGCTFFAGAHNFIQDSQRCNVVNPLLMGFRLSRDAADTYSQSISLCPSADGKSCRPDGDWSSGWIAFVDRNADGVLQPAEARGVLAKSLHDSPGLRIRSDRTHFSFIGHPQLYRARNTTGSLTICDPRGAEHSRVITVGARGLAVQSPYSPRVHQEHCA